MNRIVQRKSTTGALFLALNKPFKAICAPTVSNIFSKSLSVAGLAGFHPKDSICAWATAAVVAGFGDQTIMKVDRWKNPKNVHKSLKKLLICHQLWGILPEL